jgi:transcriptional regulator with XRE-family HTH domain
MSLRDLATAAEFEYHNLSRLENGRIGYSSDSIYRIARALDVTVADLYAEGPPVPVYWVPWGDPKETRPFIPTTTPVRKAYAIEIKDDAMSPEILRGDIAIISRFFEAAHGHLVAVRIDSEEGEKILVRRAQMIKNKPWYEIKTGDSSENKEHPVWEMVPNNTTLYETLTASLGTKCEPGGRVVSIIRDLT